MPWFFIGDILLQQQRNLVRPRIDEKPMFNNTEDPAFYKVVGIPGIE